MKRKAGYSRKTRETSIKAVLNIDGSGEGRIITPIGFFTHMLESFTRHGLFDLDFEAQGDLQTDQHHLIEDSGLVLGQVFSRALGGRKGILRAGYFVYPMDEALAVSAVDIAGRPYLQFDADFKRRFCGDMDTDLLEDFFRGFSIGLQCNVVVRMPFGRNDHHKMESVFKAFGRALKTACSLEIRSGDRIPSMKGVIDENRGD